MDAQALDARPGLIRAHPSVGSGLLTHTFSIVARADDAEKKVRADLVADGNIEQNIRFLGKLRSDLRVLGIRAS